MPETMIATTNPARCRLCGLLTPAFEHERSRTAEDGTCLCATCVRLRQALAPLLERIEALETEVALYKAKTTPRK